MKGFTYRACQSSKTIDVFYSKKYKLERKYNTSSQQGMTSDEYFLMKRLQNESKSLSTWRKKINNVYEDKGKTAEQKKNLIDEYTLKMVNKAREALEKSIVNFNNKITINNLFIMFFYCLKFFHKISKVFLF